MKKLFALILVILSLFSACSAAPAETVKLDLAEVHADMIAATDEVMSSIKEDWLFDMYGIDPADCAECYVSSFNSGIMAAEIWLIKAASPDALARLQTLAENRLAALDNQSATYSPQLNEIVKKAQIIVRGDYLAMILSSNVETLAAIFNNAK